MADRLEDLLRACTVRVVGGPEPGAGFFIAPGKVLTCVHVIATCAGGITVSPGLKVQWERDKDEPAECPVIGAPLILADKGRAISALDCDYPDIAVLDVEGLTRHPCVGIDADWPANTDGFQIYGYPREGGTVRLTPASLRYRGKHGNEPTLYLDLASDTVKPGMSGAPVLNLSTGGVCGVVVASKNAAQPDGALAVPWSAVTTELSDVLAASRAFREQDNRWDAAVAVATPAAAVAQAQRGASPSVQVVIEVALTKAGTLSSCARLAGDVVCRHEALLPAEVAEVWNGLQLPPLIAGERMAEAGRRLAHALLDDTAQRNLARRLNEIPPGQTAELVLVADGNCLSLPVELMRLTADGAEVGPIGLLANVSVIRRTAAEGSAPGDPLRAVTMPAPTAGPLKILAAVAAPDETKTKNAPLDVEAEMAAVLDATSEVASGVHAQVRILEVASLAAIREALARDAYHVLHLSAHGSPESVELEDEDGAPVTVTTETLMNALKSSGHPVPLIVLSACSGGATGSAAMAAGLVGRGANRVMAMLAPVTDTYATKLARSFYRELSTDPSVTVGQALTRARYKVEEDRSGESKDRLPRPEYGIATLFSAAGDAPLVDPAEEPKPLTVATAPPGGKGVRDLPLGSLIGRRAQLRDVMGILRRTERTTDRFGAVSGVVLTGIGGIGKTALAGRAMSRLRDEGWLIAVHEGPWKPTALIVAVGAALGSAAARISDATEARTLSQVADFLANRDVDDPAKMDVITRLLSSIQMLVVLDDFEQNLTSGGDAFLDATTDEAITRLAEASETGALLITCRYPLPGPDRLLVEVPVPPLSPAELRRMFLRHPALRDLDAEDRRLLIRAIGGHPRLIEFTDALLRGGRANLRHVQAKIRELARRQGVDLTQAVSVQTAVDQAAQLGSADILLEDLLELLTPRQADVLRQVAVCRGPMTLDDLAFALTLNLDAAGLVLTGLRSDVNRLADLTLLTPGADIEMHPWTATLVTRNAPDELAALHERALVMRERRFEQQRGTYDDLVDIPRHLAALGRYADVGRVAVQAERMLPGTLAIVAYLAEMLRFIPKDEHVWAVVAEMEAVALLNAGDLQGAARLFQALHQQMSAWAAADPANIQLQRDLSVSHNKLGDIARAVGDLAAARTSYQAGLDVIQRLTAADPANTPWQRDLSISHEKLGDIASSAGDLAAAQSHYQASLDIRQRLTIADPANTEWQRDLSISHNKLGDIASSAGDLASARTHHQAALDIIHRLSAADPANTQWQRDLSISHDKLGDIALAVGDLADARAHHQAGLDIAHRLTTADPANTQWQRDLSVSHEKLGDIARYAGDLAAARTQHQASLDIRQRLATADPANAQWQRDLSISHNKLGDIARNAGDLVAARTSYQAGLDIRQRLATADPANTQWQRDLSVSYERLGDVAHNAGDLAAARTSYQASLDIRQRLTTADPANTQWQRDLSISHNKLGDIALAVRDAAAARAAYQASLEIITRLAAMDPSNVLWQDDLRHTRQRLDVLSDTE